jgi:hypothetical protein
MPTEADVVNGSNVSEQLYGAERLSQEAALYADLLSAWFAGRCKTTALGSTMLLEA